MADQTGLEGRVDRIEARVDALLDRLDGLLESRAPGAATKTARRQVQQHRGGDSEDFWALRELKNRQPEGAVLFTGAVPTLEGGSVQWQLGETYEELAGRDWGESADRLDALGNPVRLQLLQLVMAGVCETGELAAQESLGTTGQLHHHLRVLRSAGWLTSKTRGHYEIPRSRVIPLLAILLAVQPT